MERSAASLCAMIDCKSGLFCTPLRVHLQRLSHIFKRRFSSRYIQALRIPITLFGHSGNAEGIFIAYQIQLRIAQVDLSLRHIKFRPRACRKNPLPVQDVSASRLPRILPAQRRSMPVTAE
jgi:hypothetical protein